MEGFVHEEEEVDHPMRYLPIRHVYSSTAPCTSPGAMSKKVEARKLIAADRDADEEGKKLLDRDTDNAAEPRLLVYRRRNKRARPPTSFFDLVARRVEGGAAEDNDEAEEEGVERGDTKMKKRRLPLKNELLRLGTGSSISGRARSCGLRASGRSLNFSEVRKRRCIAPSDLSGSSKVKRWVELDVEGADPDAVVGLACKVYWPMDANWYRGTVTEYNSATKQHCVNYDDGEVERLILVDEKIKFHISSEEMQHLNLKSGVSNKEKDALNYNEMLALAVSFDDCQELEPGDIVWAKLTGHAMWPAVIVDESNIGSSRSLKLVRRDQSVLVQFFGTHDFARISLKQATPFLNGLLSSLHLKCKKTRFFRSLDEAKVYLSNRQLPKSMLHLQKVLSLDDVEGSFGEDLESSEDLSGNEKMKMAVEPVIFSPLEIGDLRVTNLGKIVCDSEYFHSKLYIWPEGYTAFRMFISVKDSSVTSCYKMEVLRDEKSKLRPLFRVTTVDGEQIDGSNPTACWKEIYRRISQNQCNKLHMDAEGCKFQKSGSYMFGFTTPQISQLIQDLPNSRFCSKYFESNRDLPAGYRAVRVKWKDLDRCSVCHMDEEYENNLFLQCDKCRMMVHAKCYGEIEPLDGVLWLCNVCRPGAPKYPPPCCLCPVIGGAIKPTTDGRWAHLTCAMWIPETCLLDVKKMEPIDGINRISKDRWKLLCSICGVSYGACIQCSNSTCRVAYHPLCARAAGLCVELEDEDKLHLMSLDEDDDQCVRLLSFCKKHRQPSNELPTTDDTCILPSQQCSTYVPASNPSGCARTEPYNFFGRRGQKEPQVLAAASVKRLFLENRPHLVTGYRQNGNRYGSCCNGYSRTGNPSNVTRASLHNSSANVISMAEKYKIMKATFRKRLAFGKSKIHGFGVFAKLAHKAGDMVIEYTGELVRPSIADMREHLFYNSLVGAGTYMFRIDDERVIDATRAGSIAHLINHSCEPNCYSRVISVHGDEHIIIFAKRDISQSEELTYDYRFFSIDEQLACYCGFPRCRNVVNDIEAEEHVSKIRVPRSELIPWRGE